MAPAAADDFHSGGEHHRCADEGTGPVAMHIGAEGGVRLPLGNREPTAGNHFRILTLGF